MLEINEHATKFENTGVHMWTSLIIKKSLKLIAKNFANCFDTSRL